MKSEIGDPEDLDTALADYVHFCNALKEAKGRLRDSQRATEEAEIALRAAEKRQARARSIVDKFAKARS